MGGAESRLSPALGGAAVGGCWTVVSCPNVNTAPNELLAVAAVAANDVWAVGDGSGGTLIEHWDGSSWSIVPSPNVGSDLAGVAAVAANDVWAVGDPGTLTEHWNGSIWSVVPSPNPGGDSHFAGVAAVAANDVWAVGVSYYDYTLIEHWDGSTWSIVPSPNVGTCSNYLTGVGAVAANDVWAVGGCGPYGSFPTLIEHWDGSSWSVVPSPDTGPAGNMLYGVAAVAANDVWAVGQDSGGTLTEHWNGSTWSVVPSPNPGGSGFDLRAVAALATNDVWAVGAGPGYTTLTEHWDGSSWSIVPIPNPGNLAELWGVAAVTANDVWAVGDYYAPNINLQTLTEHYTAGPCPSPTPTATPTPAPPPITGPYVVAIEANQVVQDWQDSLPLIAGKDTVVRVHVQSSDPNPPPVRWLLRGTRNGVDLPNSPLSPDNLTGVVPQTNAQAARSTLAGTLNYPLPAQWVSGGASITLSVVDANQSLVPCGGTILPPHGCTQTVSFVDVPAPRVVLVPIQVTYHGANYTPSTIDVNEMIDRLRDVYPIAGLQVDVVWGKGEPTSYDDPHFIDNVFTHLLALRQGDTRPYFALIPDPAQLRGSGGWLNGQGVGWASTSSNPLDILGPWTAFRNEFPHELGHALGLEHPGALINGQIVGACGEEFHQSPIARPTVGVDQGDFRPYPPPPATPWSYAMVFPHNIGSALGPMGQGPEHEVWGLNVRAFLGGYTFNAIANPRQTFALMSYCVGLNTQGQGNWTWPADYEYTQLMTAIRTSSLPAHQSSRGIPATTQYLLLRGTIDHANGDAVTFRPFYRVPVAGALPTAEPGPYTVQLRDSGGQVLTSTTFNILTESPPPPGGTPEPVPPAQEPFLVSIPDNPAGTDVQMLHNGALVGQRQAGAQAPSITLLAPLGGEHITGNLDIRWQASGGSGPLTVAAYYSRDGGATWRTLEADLPGAEYVVDSQQIGGSNTALVSVEVSDGFLTASATSGIFSVAAAPPLVHIVAPQEKAPFDASQIIGVEAEGLDQQDGMLPDSSFQWSADGTPVGSGARLDLPASRFSPGLHTFQVTGQNSWGLSAQAQVNICTLTFSDVHPSDYFYTPVQYLVCRGVVAGYADATFRPYANTTRGQLSKIIVLGEGWAIDTSGGPHFRDVPPSNPFYGVIETAYHHGVISGYSDGTFRWGNNVTRAQLCKIIVGAQGWAINTTGGPHFTDVSISNTFYGVIETAYNHGIISGYSDGTFRWGNNAIRGQIAKIVYLALTGLAR
ncbi:MAG: S-layer homology domain-containing protein [Chloroflexia bacterium]